LSLSYLEGGLINVHWTFDDMSKATKTPFEVPLDVISPPAQGNKNLSDFIDFTQEQNKPLKLSVKNHNGVEIYDLMGMVFTEYLNFIEAKAITLPNSKGISGLYDRTVNDLFLEDGVYTLWPRDINHPDEDGKSPGKNVWGSHPMFFGRATDKSWFGVLYNNAVAQDWWVKNNKASGEVALKTIATGGASSLYFFFEDDANDLMQTYQKLIGKPVLVPQWIIGWGQCRWGYNSTEILMEVVNNYTANDLPLDSSWSDIDYLENYKDFTYNHNENFVHLPEFVQWAHERNVSYVPIMDLGISQRGSGYDAYTDGVEKDIFLKTEAGEIFSGRVWPGDTAFPDWSQEATADYWEYWMGQFYNDIKFDGIWLDMNEPSTMCNGPCYMDQRAKFPNKFRLPYIPGGRDLEEVSTDLDALGKDGYG
jgi:alpha-glucosidase (family GH31 glycosyl hydrolase)